jgi:hypothetical protein
MMEVVWLSISVLSFMIAGVILSAALGGAEARVQGTAHWGVTRGGGVPQ